MIARHEAHLDKTDVWAALAAPLLAETIAWRQDGRPVERDGRFYARFVAYVDANTVRERLDQVVPGEWDLTLDLLPPLPARAGGAAGDDDAASCSFKARLQILGVIREDVGTGRDYKAAATDAFKRAAVRFGIAHELYALEPNWVQVEGDGRWAKPLEDPQSAYARRAGRATEARAAARKVAPRAAAANGPAVDGPAANGAQAPVEVAVPVVVEPEPADAARADGLTDETPDCPKCGGRMWDNRLTKRNPKAPDFKCRDRSCDGVVWPARPAAAEAGRAKADAPAAQPEAPAAAPAAAAAKRNGSRTREPALDASPLGAGAADNDDLPF